MKQLNIKNDETYRKVRNLADALGISMAAAVDAAVDAALEKHGRRRKTPEELAERKRKVDAILASFDADITPEMREAVKDESWLYDENGLPH